MIEDGGCEGPMWTGRVASGPMERELVLAGRIYLDASVAQPRSATGDRGRGLYWYWCWCWLLVLVLVPVADVLVQ